MIAYFLSKLIMMFYGMLYPAYCSYKAVKTKDVKEYVHWMMYWIVFSIFSVFEVFADTFIGLWFPFYYEIKIVFVIWLLSPTTRGGSTLYRRYVHPFLKQHEAEIDGYLAEFKLRTSSLIIQWGARAFSHITNFVTVSVLRLQTTGYATDPRMVAKVTKTFSYEDFDQPDMNRNSYSSMDDVFDDSRVELSDLDRSFSDERKAPTRHRNLYSNARYGSVDEQLGTMTEISKPYSMMDLTERDEPMPPPKGRTSTRKKKEDNMYGTLPRTKRTRRAK